MTDHTRTGLIARAGLVARLLLVPAAAVAVLAGAPTAVTASLWLPAGAVVAERLARTRGRSRVDTTLVAAGGALVVLILTGLLLGVSGIGLGPRSWAIALAVIGVAGLLATEVAAHRDAPDAALDAEISSAEADPDRAATRPVRLWGLPSRTLPWAVAVLAVVAGALTVSVRATDRADVAPLQMAFGTVATNDAQVVVSSDRPSGRLELRTQAEDGTSLSYPLFSVDPDHPMTASVVLPRTGRFVITLNNPDQTEPLRSLILDR